MTELARETSEKRMPETFTVGHYLISRLKEIGVDHVFGVPGDFIMGFFKEIERSELKLINCCNELNAGYAADGYARIKGIGCVATTYAVGELSALNAIAGSFAERVPVIMISGAPSTAAERRKLLLHHTLGDYSIPRKQFSFITATTTHLKNSSNAPEEIDRVLQTCIFHQLPVYICLPSDIVHKECQRPTKSLLQSPSIETDKQALEEALNEAVQLIQASKKPVIIADVELKRYHLEKEFLDLVDKTRIPFATMLMGKAVVDENHPCFIGLYKGESSRDYVKKRIEEADCIIEIGVFLGDFNTGNFTIHIDSRKLIRLNFERVQIHKHFYEAVAMRDFLRELREQLPAPNDPEVFDILRASEACPHRQSVPFEVKPGQPLTISRFFDRLVHFLPEQAILLVDTGVALFSAAEMLMPKGTTFIGQIFYGSIGYTLGATLGALLAAPERRVVLLIGDGAFQVTCQEISTMIRYGLNPIIFLINNDGYTIERMIIDGSYNDIQPWKYHKLPVIFGGRKGFDVHTEDDLERSMIQVSKKNNSQWNSALTLIEIHTGRFDCSETLKKAGTAMARINEPIESSR